MLYELYLKSKNSNDIITANMQFKINPFKNRLMNKVVNKLFFFFILILPPIKKISLRYIFQYSILHY